MRVRYFQVQLEDQAPSIGSGVRWVLAVEGRRWVQMVTPTLQTGRVSTAEWPQLEPQEIALTADVRRSIKKTMREWRRYRPRTALVERAEQAVRG